MRYDVDKTYGIYYGDMSEDEAYKRVMEFIIPFNNIRCGPSIRKLISYGGEGIVIAKEESVLYNIRMMWVDKGKFYDGHLQRYYPDIVTVDIKELRSIKPMTKCQVHSFV